MNASVYVPSLDGKEASYALSQLGVKKANASVWRLLLLGILAGLYIGFGGQFFLVAMSGGAGKIVGGLMFSTGLILVVIAGAELFTGNMSILAGVTAGLIPARKMLKNWGVVYVGNLLGAIAFAWLMSLSGLFGAAGALNELGSLSVSVADAKLAIPFTEAVIRGVFCNMLVVLAIIMAVIARDVVSKILCIVFPITCFVACGFEHCVANMYLIPIGLLLKGVPFCKTWIMFGNLVPVTIGNIIGGVLILMIHPSQVSRMAALMRKAREGLGNKDVKQEKQ